MVTEFVHFCLGYPMTVRQILANRDFLAVSAIVTTRSQL